MNVGDTAYASFGRFGTVDVKAGKVIKVSPTGQVTVDFQEVWAGNGKKRTRRFTNTGGEIGGEWSSPGHLIDEATFTRLAAKQRATAAMNAVTGHLRSYSFRSKADLDAFVKRLNELASQVPEDWRP